MSATDGLATGSFGWADAWVPAEQLVNEGQPILGGALAWWTDRIDEGPINHGACYLIQILGEWLGRTVAVDLLSEDAIADCSLSSICWKFDEDAVPIALGVRRPNREYSATQGRHSGVAQGPDSELLRWVSSAVFDSHLLPVAAAIDRVRGFVEPLLISYAIDGVRSGFADAARRGGDDGRAAATAFGDLVSASSVVVRQHAAAVRNARV